MKARDIWNFIYEIQKTPKTNDKKDILVKYKNEPNLHLYLQYVYDEVDFVWGKSKLPVIASTPIEPNLQDEDLSEFYNMLNQMNNGILKGNSSDEAMQDYLVGKEDYYEQLLFYVIKRDIKAKIGAKLINEQMGRIIPIAPYMRCEQEKMMSKRIVYETNGLKHGALAQSKADGAFLNIQVSVEDVYVEGTTRYGRNVPSNDFLNSLSNIPNLMGWTGDRVLHGELLLKDIDGSIMDRQTGNGKINKYVKRNATRVAQENKISGAKSEASKDKYRLELQNMEDEWIYIETHLVYEIWDNVVYQDWINLKSNDTTIERFNETILAVEAYNKAMAAGAKIGNCELRLIDYKIVYDNDEAMDFYQDQLDAGLEGMVIKNLAATWEHDANRQGIIKLKDFKENDFIITGIKMADIDSDFAGGIGAYIMESSDGEVLVNVSGMKRHERGLERVDQNDSSKGLQLIDGFDFDQHIGKIAAVKYNELIKSKSNDTYSLFLPNVLEVRDRSDKTQADDIKKIKSDAKYKG